MTSFFVLLCFLLGLAALALTEAETRAPMAGGAYPATPLGLLVSRILALLSLGLTALFAVFALRMTLAVLLCLLPVAFIWRHGAGGAALSRFYKLRMPVAVGAILSANILWLRAI